MGAWGNNTPAAGGAGAADPFDAIPRLLHLAADQEVVADGYTFTTLTDRSDARQHLTVTGSITFDADGGPAGLPCYVFPDGAYGENLVATLPGSTSAPGYGLLAVLKLSDLTGYPEILEFGEASRDNATKRNAQHCVSSMGELYYANGGGLTERISAAGAVIANTWTLVCFTITADTDISASNPAFAVNGATIASSSGTGTGRPAIRRNALHVGAGLFVAYAQFLKGSLAELILVSDLTKIAAATALLRTKYSL